MGEQVSFRGIPDTIEGIAVIDGYMFPPEALGQLDEPIVLKIIRGSVASIEGGNEKSIILNNWIEGKQKIVEHLCLGYNPGARIGKDLGESERAFGTITVGFGKYPFHTDGIIKNPLILLDGKPFVQNHHYLHPDLASLEKELERTPSHL